MTRYGLVAWVVLVGCREKASPAPAASSAASATSVVPSASVAPAAVDSAKKLLNEALSEGPKETAEDFKNAAPSASPSKR